MDRDLPEGVIDADPAGGWDGVGDATAHERSRAARTSEDAPSPTVPAQPDDPIEGEAVRRGADPDVATDRGEEP